MKAIELNKTDVFECPASFGTLSQEKVNKLFTDGRRASGFLEIHLEEWYNGLEFKDGKGYDHINKHIPGQLYDAKCFTLRGANFSPSVMLGAGRRVDTNKLWEHATDMIYIFCDIVSFPEVRVIFKRGSDLTHYNRGAIPFGDRDVLFG